MHFTDEATRCEASELVDVGMDAPQLSRSQPSTKATAAYHPAARIPTLLSMLFSILLQELEHTAAVAHAQHQAEQAERGRQKAPSPRSGSPSPASRLLRVAVPGPTAMALQAQQQLLPQLSRRVSDLRKHPRQRRASLRSQRPGSLQRKSLGQPCQQELQEVPAQTQGSLQTVSEAADQLLQQQHQARAGEQLSAPATGGDGRSQEVLGEQQGLPAAGLEDRPAWHQASRPSVHLPPSGRSAASIAVADLATHGHSAQLAGAFISEPESKQVQAHLGAAAASNQAGEAGQELAGLQEQGSGSQAGPRLDGTLAVWRQDRGQSMPVKLRRQDSLQQQKVRLQRQERAMQVRNPFPSFSCVRGRVRVAATSSAWQEGTCDLKLRSCVRFSRSGRQNTALCGAAAASCTL